MTKEFNRISTVWDLSMRLEATWPCPRLQILGADSRLGPAPRGWAMSPPWAQGPAHNSVEGLGLGTGWLGPSAADGNICHWFTEGLR